MDNVLRILLRAAEENPTRVFLSWIDPNRPERKPVQITFAGFEEMVRRGIATLRSIGISPGEKVLFFADNCFAYQALMISAMAIKAEPACLYENLGNLDFMDITCRVLPKAAFISYDYHWEKLKNYLMEFGTCRAVFTREPGLEIPKEMREIPFSSVQETPPISREELKSLADALGPEDPFALIFTSGTTGGQKGVRIPQRAVMSAMQAAVECSSIQSSDLGLHILPFAHIAGQLPFYFALQTQSHLILCARREDLPRGFAMGPTYVLLVPLIYDRIEKEIKKHLGQLPSPLGRWLARGVEKSAKEAGGASIGFFDLILARLARKVVGRRLLKRLGGKIRILGAGGAPSDPELVGFFRGLGFNYLNLYGMSETAGVIAFNEVHDPKIRLGSVGKPWRELTVKIAEDGEIWVKGKTLMTGYLEKEDEEGVFTEEGFLRTGDLGWVDKEGYLYVVGRKKNILVLTTGKKVCPEPVESRIREVLPVVDAVLVGDGRPFVACGIFVSREVLAAWDEKMSREKLTERWLAEIHRGLSEFSHYEIPKKIFLIEGAPYENPKIVTPTLKINRRTFAIAYSAQIEPIYSGRSEHPPSWEDHIPALSSA